MIEVVYTSRNNPNSVIFKEDNDPIDFSATTRMVLSFDSSTIVADTATDSTLMDFTIGNGIIEFNLNSLTLTRNFKHSATLVVYDPDHISGQVLVHSRDNMLAFNFIDS